MKFIRIIDLYFVSVMVLIRTVSFFPSTRLKEWVAKSIAFVAYHVSDPKRRLSEKNLAIASDGKLRDDEGRKIVERSFHEFWCDIFSLLPSDRERRAVREAELHGLEHLQKGLKDGKGIILWENNSFGARLLAKQILHRNGFSVHQVHGENHLGGFLTEDGSSRVRHHLIKPFFDRYERQFVPEIISLPGSDSLAFTRILLDRLKQNAILCSAADGPLGQKFIPVKFLGFTELFPTGMISLAKISGAPLLPMFCIREDKGRTKLIIESPIPIEKNADRERGLEKSVTLYANLFESYIRKYPGRYRKWPFLGRLNRNGVGKYSESPK